MMDRDAGRKDDASSKDGVGSSPATEGDVLSLYSAWSLFCDIAYVWVFWCGREAADM